MQQLTPYYAPTGDDQRTHYNGNSYYSNYGFSPNQAPPHPDANSVYRSHLAHGTAPMGFASPPPPTLQDVYSEFGPPTSHVVDLLDTSNAVQPAYATTQEESRLANSVPREISMMEGIPSEIIASQERAIAEAKHRTQTGSLTTTSSRALTTSLPVVPESNNPTGSDAVHPNRLVWKHSRGGKTAAGAASGALVGGVIFGPAFPVGMVLGGAAGGYVTNKLSKSGERRAQRKWEQSNFQRVAAHSPVVNATMV